MRGFLIFGALAAFGWLFVKGSPPSTDASSAASVPRVASIDRSAASETSVDRSTAPETRRAPVPFVRNVRMTPTSMDTPAPAQEKRTQDGVDRQAAKAAIETDGYKGVTVVGKGANGLWHAKAYRGATEVELTVDAAGRVSMR